MTISVCCLSGAPGPRIRALIEPLREIADEVVIAADARVNEAALAEYAAVADRVFRVEVVYAERHLAWMHAQCSGDWIFRIDADEVASPALVASIPKLISNRSVREYWLPRRWLFPGADSWLDEPPWWPDYQLRLYRNDCFLRFSGALHSSAVSQAPTSYLEAPLYHLDLLLNNIEQREAKATFYDSIRPGLEAPNGGTMNQRYYLPERASSLELTAVPDDDRCEIERVLTASAVTAGALGRRIPVTEVAETDVWLEGRPFDPEVHRAEIAPIETTVRMVPNEVRGIHFRVTNTGRAPWPWHNPEIDEGRQVRLSYHWLNEDGSIFEHDGLLTWLPCRLQPGRSTVVPLIVRAPDDEGTYVLDVDLVHERWFGCSVRVTVPVGRRELMTETRESVQAPVPPLRRRDSVARVCQAAAGTTRTLSQRFRRRR